MLPPLGKSSPSRRFIRLPGAMRKPRPRVPALAGWPMVVSLPLIYESVVAEFRRWDSTVRDPSPDRIVHVTDEHRAVIVHLLHIRDVAKTAYVGVPKDG